VRWPFKSKVRTVSSLPFVYRRVLLIFSFYKYEFKQTSLFPRIKIFQTSLVRCNNQWEH